jgi:hypothetical protein
MTKEAVMDSPCSKKWFPVLGGVLYVVLSVLFGSLWYAALSLAMTRLAPEVRIPMPDQQATRTWLVLSTLALLRSEDVGQPVGLASCRRDYSHQLGKPCLMDAPALR